MKEKEQRQKVKMGAGANSAKRNLATGIDDDGKIVGKRLLDASRKQVGKNNKVL